MLGKIVIRKKTMVTDHIHAVGFPALDFKRCFQSYHEDLFLV